MAPLHIGFQTTYEHKHEHGKGHLAGAVYQLFFVLINYGCGPHEPQSGLETGNVEAHHAVRCGKHRNLLAFAAAAAGQVSGRAVPIDGDTIELAGERVLPAGH